MHISYIYIYIEIYTYIYIYTINLWTKAVSPFESPSTLLR